MEHIQTVEMDWDGYRYWSAPMPASWVKRYIDMKENLGQTVSDVDCHMSCPCLTPVVESN